MDNTCMLETMQGMPIVLNQRLTAWASFHQDWSRSLILCTQCKSMVRPAFSPALNAISRQVLASFPANSLGDPRLASVSQSHQCSALESSAKNKNKWLISGPTFSDKYLGIREHWVVIAGKDHCTLSSQLSYQSAYLQAINVHTTNYV